MRRRSRILLGIFIFFSWNIVTYIIFVSREPSKDDKEKKSLDLQNDIDKTLKLLATKHETKHPTTHPTIHPSTHQKLYKTQMTMKGSSGSIRKDGTNAHSLHESLPVLVMACDRPTVKRNIDQLLKYRTSAEQFPIIVSQDCGHGPTADAIKSYNDQLIHIQHPDLSFIELSKKESKFRGYFQIARHYKWALSQIFHQFNYSSAIIVEDDLDIAPDFFEYFLATREILRSDPTLWCVSAWNDNGKTDMISDDPQLLYRTDFFPGLGWMLEKKTWLELEDKWPRTFWDDWMRQPEQRKDRACIRPEIPRTSTFGRQGVSKGQYFDKHLKFIQHNTKYVPFTKIDLSYLLQENYVEPFVRMVYGSPRSSTDKLLADEEPDLHTVRIQYREKDSFRSQARQLGIMDDFKSGVPRCGYRGIVSFMFRGRRVYLSPPSDWTGYDATWN